jgi:hypothetical protein
MLSVPAWKSVSCLHEYDLMSSSKGPGLAVAIVEMRWSWGWSVNTGGGASCDPGLPLAAALVVCGVVDQAQAGYAACWGPLGQPVLVVMQ